MSDIFKYALVLLPLSLASSQVSSINGITLSKSLVFFAEADEEEEEDDDNDTKNGKNSDEKINDKLTVEGRAEVDLGFNFDANHPKKPNLKPMMISKKKDKEKRGMSWDFEADLILKKDFTWSDNVLKFLLDINCNPEDTVSLDSAKVDFNGYYFGYIPSLSLGGKIKYLGLGKIFKPIQCIEFGVSFEKQKEIKSEEGAANPKKKLNNMGEGYTHNSDIPTFNLMFKYKFDDNFGHITFGNMFRPILLSKKLDKPKQDASGVEKEYDFVLGFNPKLSTQLNFKPDWSIFKADVSFINGTGDYFMIGQLKDDVPQTLIIKDEMANKPAGDKKSSPHTSMKYLNANISYEHHWTNDFYTQLSIGDFLCLKDFKKRQEYDENFKNVIFSNLILSYKISKFLEISGIYGLGYKSLQKLKEKTQNNKDNKDESNFASHFGICMEATLSND